MSPSRANRPAERPPPARAAGAGDRRRRLWLLGAASALAVLLVAVVVTIGAFEDDPAARSSTTTVGGRSIRGAAETAALLRGLPQHGPTLGRPDAPVTILEISDLKCPSCQRHAITTQREIVDRLVRTGRARLQLQLVNFRDPARGTSDGEGARHAAYGLLATNRFWSFVQTAFWNQGPTGRAWATEPFLRAVAAAAPGVEPGDVAVRATPGSRAAVAHADRLATGLRTNETPSLYVLARGSRTARRVTAIDDVDALANAVDRATAEASESDDRP